MKKHHGQALSADMGYCIPRQASSMPLLHVEDLQTDLFLEDGVLRAVNGVNIDIDQGEIVGLVGESGCGKSMTARSILRLLPEEADVVGGTVMYNGTDLLQASEKQLNRIRGKEISAVFQDPLTFLNPVMKIKSQIAEPLRLHEGLSKSDAGERAVDILKSMGMGDALGVAESFPHQLSGGMRQRVLLGIALSCRPSFLIADEPFTAVDVSIQDQLMMLLQQMQRELGFACLLITHDLSVAAEICDRIYVMYAGEIIESGDTFTMFGDPKHPYTQGLIGSAGLAHSETDELPYIPGSVPSMLDPPAGCRFHPRCPFAFEPCDKESPVRTEIQEESHWVRCWLHG